MSIFRSPYASISDGIKIFDPMSQIRTLRWGFTYEGRKVSGKGCAKRKVDTQLLMTEEYYAELCGL